MEPLSATASIIAVIGLAEKIIAGCRTYVSALKDAPNDLCNILIEVGSVKCTLETLEMRQKLSPVLQRIDVASSPLEGCRRELEALAQLLPVNADPSRKRKRGKFIPSYAELAWPLKQGKARKILEDLGRHKATLVLILTTDAGQDIKSIKDNVEKIMGTLTDQQRDLVLKWLVKTDPSSNHNRACQLHETHTGQWLVRSTEYNAWLGGTMRLLWLHGIPGSGKTILASFIVQNIKRFCETSALSDTGWAYYYCYFGRNQDESHPLLRWIISQLWRQLKYIPGKLCSLYNLGTEPGYADLLEVFSTIVDKFRRVYIVVDALDESQDRRFLLDLLIRIASDDAFRKVSLLTTSRKELDIQRAFEGTCSSISLSNPLVDKDICVYVENQLKTDRKLSRWPEPLRRDIRDALTRGAKGMYVSHVGFRWAACQLDILGRLNSKPGIQKALKELPETLEDIYERILVGIPKSNRSIAQKALQLLVAEGQIAIEKIAEAVVVDIDQYSFTTDSRLFDPTDLLEICTCLMAVDEDNQVGFAHYTVQEYLTSKRMLDGPAAMFRVSIDEAETLMTTIHIVYLLNLPYDRLPTAKEFFRLDLDGREALENQMRRNYPLMEDALLVWNADMKRRSILVDASLTELTLRLLDPRGAHFRGFEEQSTIVEQKFGTDPFRIKFVPGAESSMTLAYICRAGLAEVAEVLVIRYLNSSILRNRLEPCFDSLEHLKYSLDAEGPPLQVAAMMGKADLVEIFIRYGADVNASHGGWTVLTSTLRSVRHDYGEEERRDYRDVVRLLLRAGADPNPPGVYKTPLQLAVERCHHIDIVRLLLAAGAAVNAVGNDEAIAIDVEVVNEEAGAIDVEYGFATTTTRHDSRRTEFYYGTPLLIAEKMVHNPYQVETTRYPYGVGTTQYKMEVERLAEVQAILVQHGAVSCSWAPQNRLPMAARYISPIEGGTL